MARFVGRLVPFLDRNKRAHKNESIPPKYPSNKAEVSDYPNYDKFREQARLSRASFSDLSDSVAGPSSSSDRVLRLGGEKRSSLDSSENTLPRVPNRSQACSSLKMAEKDVYYTAPDNISEKGVKVFLYNPRTGQICGRTCSSWCKITIFYIIFYLCLSAFWTIMLVIFYQTLDAEKPKWQLDGSRIGNVPGLGFRPQPPEETIDSTLVWFKHGGHGNDKNHWINNLNEFLDPYHKQDTTKDGSHRVCTADSKISEREKRVCFFPMDKIKEPCTADKNYGYDIGHPCVLIKMNRVFNWEPEPYENDVFPDNIHPNISENYDPNQVYISCEGENVADQENMGPIEYYPSNSFANYYFPFTNINGYVSPFVFVHFTKPAFGVLINIECKAWAKNIIHDRMERKGSVHLELLVD